MSLITSILISSFVLIGLESILIFAPSIQNAFIAGIGLGIYVTFLLVLNAIRIERNLL